MGIQEVGWQRGCRTDRVEVRAWMLSLDDRISFLANYVLDSSMENQRDQRGNTYSSRTHTYISREL